MTRIERNVIIKRPIEEVFAFVTDIDNFHKWFISVIKSKKTSPGPIGLGTIEHEIIYKGYFFLKGENTSVITDYQLNKMIAWRTTSSHFPPWESIYKFESIEGITKLTYILKWKPNGFQKLLTPLIILVITIFDVIIPLQKLKNILESQCEKLS